MCWDCDNHPKGDPHKDYIRGGVEVDDFYKEVDYSPRTKKKKRERSKTSPGCPENDYGPHVYVWTSEYITREQSFFFRVFGWHKWEENVCAGCGKYSGKSRRLTEAYEKVKERRYAKAYGDGTNIPRGEPVSRKWKYNDRKPDYSMWHWENLDEKYIRAREDYLARPNKGWEAKMYVEDRGWFWTWR